MCTEKWRQLRDHTNVSFTNSEELSGADSRIRLGGSQTLPNQAGEAKQVPAPTEKVPLPEGEKQVLGVASCDGWIWKAPSAGKGKSL